AAMGRIVTIVAGGVPPSALSDELERDRWWSAVVGSEAHGIDASVVADADVRVTIPMVGGIESLNASVAGSIVAYELAGWRRRVGPPAGADPDPGTGGQR